MGPGTPARCRSRADGQVGPAALQTIATDWPRLFVLSTTCCVVVHWALPPGPGRFLGHAGTVFEADALAVLAREVLRERRAALIQETCAWTVGMSDRPNHLRRHGRLVATGGTLGERAAAGLPLSGEEDGRLDLGD